MISTMSNSNNFLQPRQIEQCKGGQLLRSWIIQCGFSRHTPDDIAINEGNLRVRNIDSFFNWRQSNQLNITQVAITANAKAKPGTGFLLEGRIGCLCIQNKSCWQVLSTSWTCSRHRHCIATVWSQLVWRTLLFSGVTGYCSQQKAFHLWKLAPPRTS